MNAVIIHPAEEQYVQIAFRLMHSMNSYHRDAQTAVTNLNTACIYFAKHVFQYLVCSDDDGTYVPLSHHEYDDDGQMNILYFMSLDKLKHKTSTEQSKSLYGELQRLWDMYAERRWVSVCNWLTVYQYWNEAKNNFKKYMKTIFGTLNIVFF